MGIIDFTVSLKAGNDDTNRIVETTSSGSGGSSGNQINIGDTWKTISGFKINIGDVWKDVEGLQINIGDAWKTISLGGGGDIVLYPQGVVNSGNEYKMEIDGTTDTTETIFTRGLTGYNTWQTFQKYWLTTTNWPNASETLSGNWVFKFNAKWTDNNPFHVALVNIRFKVYKWDGSTKTLLWTTGLKGLTTFYGNKTITSAASGTITTTDKLRIEIQAQALRFGI